MNENCAMRRNSKKQLVGSNPCFGTSTKKILTRFKETKIKKLNDFDSKLKACEIDTLYPKLGHEKASQHKKGREKAIF